MMRRALALRPHAAAAAAAAAAELEDATLHRVVQTADAMTRLALSAVANAFRAVAAKQTDKAAHARARAALRGDLEAFAAQAATLRDGDAAAGLDPTALAALREEAALDATAWEAVNAFVANGYFLETQISGRCAVAAADVAAFADEAISATRASVERMGAHARAAIERRVEARRAEADLARKTTSETLENLRELTLGIQLIALNASVEAARAGQAGRGFAVIAQEIKALSDSAQRSVEAVSKSLAGR